MSTVPIIPKPKRWVDRGDVCTLASAETKPVVVEVMDPASDSPAAWGTPEPGRFLSSQINKQYGVNVPLEKAQIGDRVPLASLTIVMITLDSLREKLGEFASWRNLPEQRLRDSIAQIERRDQGYAIRCFDDHILLIGHDRSGLLGAAATFLQMCVLEESGLSFHRLDIDDWPVIPGRGTWIFSQNVLHHEDSERTVEFLEWLARFKFNYLLVHYDGGGAAFPFSRKSVVGDERVVAFNHLIEHAHKLGIKVSLSLPHVFHDWQEMFTLSSEEKEKVFRCPGVMCPGEETTFQLYTELFDSCLAACPEVDSLWLHVSETDACWCDACEASGGYTKTESAFYHRLVAYARQLKPGLEVGLWRGHTALARYDVPSDVILCPWRYELGEDNLTHLSRAGCPEDDEALFETPNPKAFTGNPMGFPGIPYEYEPIEEIRRYTKLSIDKGCTYLFPMWASSLVHYTDGCLAVRVASAEFGWNNDVSTESFLDRFCRQQYGNAFKSIGLTIHQTIGSYTQEIADTVFGYLGGIGSTLIRQVFESTRNDAELFAEAAERFDELVDRLEARIREVGESGGNAEAAFVQNANRILKRLVFWRDGHAHYHRLMIEGAKLQKNAVIYYQNKGDRNRAEQYSAEAISKFREARDVLKKAYADVGYVPEAFDSPEWRRTLAKPGMTLGSELFGIDYWIRSLENEPFAAPLAYAAFVVHHHIPEPFGHFYRKHTLINAVSTRLPIRSLRLDDTSDESDADVESLGRLAESPPGTHWVSPANVKLPVRITLDIGPDRFVNRVALKQTDGAHMTKDYLVELSRDGVEWVEVCTNRLLAVPGSVQMSKFRPVTASFVRITLISPHGDQAQDARVGLSGVAVYQPWME